MFTLDKEMPIFRQGVYKTYPSEVLKKEYILNFLQHTDLPKYVKFSFEDIFETILEKEMLSQLMNDYTLNCASRMTDILHLIRSI